MIAGDEPLDSGSAALNVFLKGAELESHPEEYCELDDYDVMGAIKKCMSHPDKVLSLLCRGLIDRHLLKVKLQADPLSDDLIKKLTSQTLTKYRVTEKEIGYLVFHGETSNTTYNFSDERIQILFKDGSTRDISQVDNALINQELSSPVKKFYICYMS